MPKPKWIFLLFDTEHDFVLGVYYDGEKAEEFAKEVRKNGVKCYVSQYEVEGAGT